MVDCDMSITVIARLGKVIIMAIYYMLLGAKQEPVRVVRLYRCEVGLKNGFSK